MARLSIALFLSLLALSVACRNGAKLLRKSLNAQQRTKIVELHNQMRNKVASGGVPSQSKAQNMREMVWDNEMAQRAQSWADNCVFEHDSNRKDSKGKYFGQNLVVTWAQKDPGSPNIEKMIDTWFNEVYEHGYTGGYNSKTGHYSQLIWADSNKVGCGLTSYLDTNKLYSDLLVCNYSPAGNVIGQQAYVKGSRNCSKFNLSNSKKFNSLCA
uniref:Venom allergen 5 n=1 Tax=Lygus hesperus TaxID=30085 RepID=A0A0A9ZC82_LYGHE